MKYGKVTYSYTPERWSQERFLLLGGFSVVFLNYNKAKSIEKSVASTLNQDFPLLEMFFMDDASTDGSGDTMERLVKEYRGRHKVTVVRNIENQNITGQWNIVSKLATGNWYGMFCADDEALLDRVSKSAQLIAGRKNLRGMCTSGKELNLLTGEDDKLIGRMYPAKVAKGTDSPWETAFPYSAIIGASAFWHKTLFDKALPKVPLDDVLLRWILQMKNSDVEQIVWEWFPNELTIRYTVGEGVSSSVHSPIMSNVSKRVKWKSGMEASRKYATIMAKTWGGIESYYLNNKAPADYNEMARYNYVLYLFRSKGTIKRMAMLPSVLSLIKSNRVPSVYKKFALNECIKRFVFDFLGLSVESFIVKLVKKW